MMIKQGWLWVGILLFAASASAQTTVTTSGGTNGSVPVFTGSSTLGNSVITQSNGNIGIGAAAPNNALDIDGAIGFANQNSHDKRLFSPTDGLLVWLTQQGAAAHAFEIQEPITPGTTSPTVTNIHLDGNGNSYLNGLSGNVGIGTTSPTAKLEVDGNIKLTVGSGASITFPDGTVQSTAYTGVACGGDYAEAVDVSGDRKHYGPGDLLVLDPNHPGDVLKSGTAYSTSIAGIYSTKPGYVGRRMTGPKGPNEVPMAMVGIVPTHVTAMNGPIHVGDLLVASSIPGYAMRGTDRSRMLGAVVGKAMGNLDSGKGEIEVLVTLQ